MNRFYVAVLFVCILIFSTDKLFSQDRTISSDTAWKYNYTSETDSTFYLKSLNYAYDSANFKETISLRTEELHGDWQAGSRISRLYDDSDILISSLMSSWDANLNQWRESNLMEFFVDEYGNDTLVYISNFVVDEWISAQGFRSECTYNPSGQLTQEILYMGLPGQETEHEKLEYTLDESGNQISTLRYRFDTDWFLYRLSDASYDGNDLMVEKITYSRIGDEWVELQKDVYAYDTDGRMTLHEIHEWNEVSGQWAMTSLKEFNYNADGEWSLRTQLNYTLDGEHWQTNRDEYFYNLSGKLVIHLSTMFYEETGQYLRNQKTFYQHAGDYFVLHDSICTGEIYEWKGESFLAGGTYRKEYVSVVGLDSIYTLSLQEHPLPASFVINGPSEVIEEQEVQYMVPEDAALSYTWEVENGTVLSGLSNDTLAVRWDMVGVGEVAAWASNIHGCYSDTTTILVSIGTNGLEDLSGETLMLYPVPVHDMLRIKTNYESMHLELMDASGRMVVVAEGLEIDLSHLDSGIYLVRLKDSHGKLLGTRKILKE